MSSVIEEKLHEGKIARVRWSWDGRHFVGNGFIQKITPQMVTVELTQEVRSFNEEDQTDDVWEPGHRISVPHKGTKAWSKYNRYELV